MSSPSHTARLRPIKTLVPTSQGNKKVSVCQVGQVGQVIGVTVSDRFGPTNCSSFFTNCPFAGLKFDASFFPTCQVRASRFQIPRFYPRCKLLFSSLPSFVRCPSPCASLWAPCVASPAQIKQTRSRSSWRAPVQSSKLIEHTRTRHAQTRTHARKNAGEDVRIYSVRKNARKNVSINIYIYVRQNVSKNARLNVRMYVRYTDRKNAKQTVRINVRQNVSKNARLNVRTYVRYNERKNANQTVSIYVRQNVSKKPDEMSEYMSDRMPGRMSEKNVRQIVSKNAR